MRAFLNRCFVRLFGVMFINVDHFKAIGSELRALRTESAEASDYIDALVNEVTSSSK